MSLGLAAARSAVQALLNDPTIAETVTITRDPERSGDDILDETTLALVPAVGDSTLVYTGPALVAPASTRTEPGVEGGAGSYPDAYQAKLPIDCPVLTVGDTLTVTSSPDPALVGRVFTIDAVPGTGRRITTRISLHARINGPRR